MDHTTTPRTAFPDWRPWFSSLFDHLGTRGALLVALLVASTQVLLARTGVQLDPPSGAGRAGLFRATDWAESLTDLAIVWPLAALLVWLCCRAFKWDGSLVQFIGIVGVARVPLAFSGVLLWLFEDQLFRSWFDDGVGPGGILLSLAIVGPLRFLPPLLLGAGVAWSTRLTGWRLLVLVSAGWLVPRLVIRYLWGGA